MNLKVGMSVRIKNNELKQTVSHYGKGEHMFKMRGMYFNIIYIDEPKVKLNCIPISTYNYSFHKDDLVAEPSPDDISELTKKRHFDINNLVT